MRVEKDVNMESEKDDLESMEESEEEDSEESSDEDEKDRWNRAFLGQITRDELVEQEDNEKEDWTIFLFSGNLDEREESVDVEESEEEEQFRTNCILFKCWFELEEQDELLNEQRSMTSSLFWWISMVNETKLNAAKLW